MAGCTSDDKRRTAVYVPRDDDRAMIFIHQRIVPRSRTGTGSLWEASTEIGSKTYSAVSRHGAPQALARVLLAAGILDQPVEVRSEICVFDDGKTIRADELKGCIGYRSLHAMARYTFQEGDRPLHRVRYTERPGGIFPGEEKQLPEGVVDVVGKNAFHKGWRPTPPKMPVRHPMSKCVSVALATGENAFHH
jgi:hypothetical protein